MIGTMKGFRVSKDRKPGPMGYRRAMWIAQKVTGLRSYRIKHQIDNPGQPDHKTWVSDGEIPPAVEALQAVTKRAHSNPGVRGYVSKTRKRAFAQLLKILMPEKKSK